MWIKIITKENKVKLINTEKLFSMEIIKYRKDVSAIEFKILGASEVLYFEFSTNEECLLAMLEIEKAIKDRKRIITIK